MARRRKLGSGVSGDLDPLVRLWMLRLLVLLGGQREFMGTHGFRNDAVAVALGLGYWVDEAEFDLPDYLKGAKAAAVSLRSSGSNARCGRCTSRLKTASRRPWLRNSCAAICTGWPSWWDWMRRTARS